MRSGVGAFCVGSRRRRDFLLAFFFFEDAGDEFARALECEDEAADEVLAIAALFC